MSTKIKRRSWTKGTVSGIQRSSIFAAWTPYLTPGPISSEVSYSLQHFQLPGGRWSGGGPWIMDRDVYAFSPETVPAYKVTTGGSNLVEGSARIAEPAEAVNKAPAFSTFTDSQLDAMGATAIARTEPLNPAFDLSVFLGELRAEGLPNLPGTAIMERTKAAKAAGSEYLNVEFGWLPLVRGIRDFAATVEQSDSILRNFQEGQGKAIQRSYEWPREEESRAQSCRFSMYPPVGFFDGGGLWTHSFRRTWFEVEYIYHVPTGNRVNDKIRRYGAYARKLLGVDLSPEVLWNLAPWSWAADWFANTGDVMHNISAIAQHGLVIRHGYIMSHVGYQTVSSGTHHGHYQVLTRTQESKRRRAATPYGFGVLFSDLSPEQVAVLAALGISRW